MAFMLLRSKISAIVKPRVSSVHLIGAHGIVKNYFCSMAVAPEQKALPDIPSNLKLVTLQEVTRPPPTNMHVAIDPPSMEVPVLDIKGNQVDTITLDRRVFGVPIRRDIVHEVVRWQRAKKRKGGNSTKRVPEIRGSTRKLRPQKGMGRARVGMNRRCGRIGGMKAHGPVRRNYSFKLNKKVVKLGLRVTLSSKLRERNLHVVQTLDTQVVKTAEMAKALEENEWDSSTLFIAGDGIPESFQRSTNNIPGVMALPASECNVYDMLLKKKLVLSVDGIKNLEDALIEKWVPPQEFMSAFSPRK
eukprot:CAMPEP_0113941116 /NCGR_PEP_ID=MMETSP1339-20121228/7112_1 /TAXON_ID=94617 /ORGANISM="Fibrocapsa japonica" /LENGTH=301 /DNA_ID=CAMNT_0000945177 /DNA_START=1 /DNA_END=906 /DNA_ORIENTATION=- /assembly_acc=CAM_ASM_000762